MVAACFWGMNATTRPGDAAAITALGGTPYATTAPDYQSKNAILRAELEAGRTMGVVRTYRGWDTLWPLTDGEIGPDGLPHDFEQWCYDGGRRVVLSFQNRYSSGVYIPFADVADPNTTYDAEIDAFGDRLIAFMAPRSGEIVVCPTHEPDMAYAKAGQTDLQMRASYVSMVQKIITRVRARPGYDAAKIKWAFITVGTMPDANRTASYAGNSYIDYVGADPYCWFGSATGGSWLDATAVMNQFLVWARGIGKTGQYCLIGETGILEGIPILPATDYAASPTPITINCQALRGPVSTGYLVRFPGGVVATVASPGAALGDTALPLVSLPGAITTTGPGSANTTTTRKAQWFTDAGTDIPVDAPEVRYWCYFTGAAEKWWIDQSWQGSVESLAAWVAMGQLAYFQPSVVIGELSSLTLTPAFVQSGDGAIGTVVLSTVAPVGGTAVALTSSDARVTVPPSVTVTAGQTVATFPITTTPDPALYLSTITATVGTTTLSVILTVQAGAGAPTAPMLLRGLDDDEATVVIDLTEVNYGAPYGFLVAADGWDMGGGELDDSAVDEDDSGAVQYGAHRPRTVMTVPLWCIGSNADDLKARIRALGQYLDRREMTWEYRGEGQQDSLLIDGFRSSIPRVLYGQASGALLAQNHYVARVDLQIRRQQKLRMRKVLVFDTILANRPGQDAVLFTNPGNVRSPMEIFVQPLLEQADFVQMYAGRKSFGALTEALETFTGFSIADATFPTDSGTTGGATHADADAANGFVAITVTPDTAFDSRWHMVWTPTDPTALEGTHMAVVGAKFQGGAVYKVQIRAGTVDGSALNDVNDITTLDCTDFADETWWTLYLDLVDYDATSTALALEGWASSSVAGQSITWDVFKPMPASEALISCYEPTFKGFSGGRIQWVPSTDFLIPADINLPSTAIADGGPAQSRYGDGELDLTVDNRVRIGGAPVVGTGGFPDRNDEAVGTPSNTGFRLDPGSYVAYVNAALHDNTKNASTLAELRIRNFHTSVSLRDEVVAVMKNVKGQADTVGTWAAAFSVGGSGLDRYQVQVVWVHDRDPLIGGGLNRYAFIDDAWLSFVRSISNPERLVWDARAGRAYGHLPAQGASHELIATGIPEAEAGPNLFVFQFDRAPSAGSELVDSRGPLPRWDALARYRCVGYVHPQRVPE